MLSGGMETFPTLFSLLRKYIWGGGHGVIRKLYRGVVVPLAGPISYH